MRRIALAEPGTAASASFLSFGAALAALMAMALFVALVGVWPRSSGAPARAGATPITSPGEHVGPTAGIGALPVQAQGLISSALGSAQPGFAARATRGGWGLAGGGVRGVFGARGAVLRAGDARLSLRLVGVARGDGAVGVGAAVVSAEGNRLGYRYAGLGESFQAGPLGIEQRFVLARRPAGDAGAVTVTLALGGTLRARLVDGTVRFFSPAGAPVMGYGGLSAVDATGRRLAASLALGPGVLRLRVADRGARYPLRIDPLIQQSVIAPDDESGAGNLGFSVALSSDGSTVLVGAPGDNSNAGAAWVFTRSGGAWTEQAKLVADCTSGCANEGMGEDSGGNFGISVALSSDGSTALIGAPNDDSNAGTAWVFTRSGNAWTQQQQGGCSASVRSTAMASAAARLAAAGSATAWRSHRTGTRP